MEIGRCEEPGPRRFAPGGEFSSIMGMGAKGGYLYNYKKVA